MAASCRRTQKLTSQRSGAQPNGCGGSGRDAGRPMNVAVLGSTGSIGTSTLKVIEQFPGRYRVVGLAAEKNADLLARQIRTFRPHVACLANEHAAQELKTLVGQSDCREIVAGHEGLLRVAALDEADIVVAAIAGSAGLLPTLAAVRAGKTIALANKEVLVMAGELITRESQSKHVSIIPVDSEHSAVYQLLHGTNGSDLSTIILTASGGPFLDYTKEELVAVTPQEALRHPRWKMGTKVTIDSATLMNKGLEIIEAHWLFGLPPDMIRVVVHPQSIIHSMVEFVDGTVFAQLSRPDMRGPIAYALSCPDRLTGILEPLTFDHIKELTFRAPDTERFPALRLAYQALHTGGLMPSVLNAANEIAVQSFCRRAITFPDIPAVTAQVMERFTSDRDVTLENILWADAWAKSEARNIIGNVRSGVGLHQVNR